MCGVYGYIGNEAACKIILAGLQKLEYRGYDSWGMVTLANEQFHQIKRLGYITKSSVPETTLPGNVGIGHVRWATHGSILEKNTHPHFDCKNEIAIVHNGVIYNEKTIRNKGSSPTFGTNRGVKTTARLFILRKYASNEALSPIQKPL